MPNSFNKKNYFSLGFTLIELLVVISIIGILATLLAANLNSARSRARDAERKSDLKNISTALRLYFNDHGFFPSNDNAGNILGCGSTGTSTCSYGSSWIVGNTVYMQMLPKDPLPNQGYLYQVGGTKDTFTISACLENASDVSGVYTANTSWCTTNWQFQISM